MAAHLSTKSKARQKRACRACQKRAYGARTARALGQAVGICLWAYACGHLLVRADLALDGGKGEWTAAAIESLKDDLVFLSLLHFNGLQRVAFKEVLLL